jgi:excinuclease ABC subunit C
MGVLFLCRKFTGFGPSSFSLSSALPVLHQVHGNRTAALRKQIRELCPRSPGVYGMLDANAELIYVGKAKLLRGRLLSYFRVRSRDPKAGHIVAQSRTIVWEETPSEFGALLRELELIRRWRPRLNVQGQPHRRLRTYICLGRRPAPHLFVSRRPPAGTIACFGPVLGLGRARDAVRRLNDLFRLRDCPKPQTMHFADQGELFPIQRAAGCIRHEIGTCLGPCAAACSSTDYRTQVRAVRAFLSGKDDRLLDRLKCAMTDAAASQQFERAAGLRDKLDILRWLGHQLARIRQARERHSHVYVVKTPQGAPIWYITRQGRIEAVLPAPVDSASGQKAATILDAVFFARRARFGIRAIDEVDMVLLVDAWFRRYPDERAKTLSPEGAMNLCRRPELSIV